MGRGQGEVITVYADDLHQVWLSEVILLQGSQQPVVHVQAIQGAIADDSCFVPKLAAKNVIGDKGNSLPDLVISGDGVNIVLVNPGPDPTQPLRVKSPDQPYYPDGVPTPTPSPKPKKH